MPPQKRRCASCRYFQSNQLSSKNGWCTHPGRQTSSDVRILVRTDELACRNSWGSDLWVGTNGETASVSADAGETAPLPIPIPRRDDEVTSVVHRDANGRLDMRSGDVVERDDMLVHEASLFPERLSYAAPDEDVNHGAVADQEHRARVLAREGTSSAIQNARERMLARRSPQPVAITNANETASDSSINEPAPVDARSDASHDRQASASVDVNADDAGEAESETPVESPIRTAAPRTFGRRGSIQPAPDESQDALDDDIYNRVPERDHSIELPLAQPSDAADDTDRSIAATEAEDSITVYDAVLQRAREIREATGRENPVFHDDAAAAERRARRRIQSIPERTQPATSPERLPVSAAPIAGSTLATPVPGIPAREVARATQMRADSDTPRRQTLTTQQAQATPRMGISLSDLKQQTTSKRSEEAAQPAQPNRVSFRRSDERNTESATAVESPPTFVAEPEVSVLPVQAARPAVHDAAPPPRFDDEDDYLPLEEPQSQPAVRRRSFGRLSNPWKRDREQVTQERQTLAQARAAIGPINDPWDEPGIDEVSDEYADDTVLGDAQDPRLLVPNRGRIEESSAPTAAVASDRTVVRTEAMPTSNVVLPTNPQPERVPSNQRTVSPTPTRSSSLYRPVHESLLHVDERDTPPREDAPREPMPAPRPPARRPTGNGATVLRVRADGLSEQGDSYSPWDSDQQSRDARDEEHARDESPWNGEPDLYEPQLQEVAFSSAQPSATSPWSFAPAVDLDTVEGMATFRGRLFGATSASRGERQPNDDLVVDIPTHAEIPVSAQHAPTPVRDSPLRSANYRGEGGPPQDRRTNLGTRPSEQPRTPSRTVAPRSGEQRLVAQEQFRPFDDASFDLRALLDESVGDVLPEVSISPDVPRMCQTCRDFRPSESGERGFCANNWAFSHRQMVNAESLPCRSSIGCWWLPSDAIWMPEEREDRTQEELPERRRRSG